MIDAIKQIALQDDEIDIVWLYGSRATDTFHAKSDYDLALSFKNFIKNSLDARLRPEELAITWSRQLVMPHDKLSIVDIAHIPTALAWEIISKGKVIVNKNAAHLAEIETLISRKYELDLQYHRKMYG